MAVINLQADKPMYGSLGNPIRGTESDPIYCDYLYGTFLGFCIGYNSTNPPTNYNTDLPVANPGTYYYSNAITAGRQSQISSSVFSDYEYTRYTNKSLLPLDTYTDGVYSFPAAFAGKFYRDEDVYRYDADLDEWYLYHEGLGDIAVIDAGVKFYAFVYSNTYGVLATASATANVNQVFNLFGAPPLNEVTFFDITWTPSTQVLAVETREDPLY